MKRLSLALLLLWAAPLFAADQPVAKLSGPKAVEVGSAIILNPTGSVGTLEFGLASGPAAAPIVRLKSDDGSMQIGFSTAAAPGAYLFYVCAWADPVAGKPPWETPKSYAFWLVTVGEVPPPTPPTPPPSDGLLGLAKASREGAAKVGSAVRAAQGPKLAAAHRSLANDLNSPMAVPAGTLDFDETGRLVPKPKSSPWPADPAALASAVLAAKRAKNNAAGVDAAAWAPWAASVDPAVQALYAAGRLKTVADWQETLNEIALGLEQQ